jgi:fucose permease
MFVMLALFPLLNRYNEKVISWTCLALTSLAIIYSVFINYYVELLVFAAAIGVCNSLLGTMSNVVVMAHSSAANLSRNLALLHVMYGLGSMMGTVITGQIIGVGLPWFLALLGLVPFIGILAWKSHLMPDAVLESNQQRQQPIHLQTKHWLVIAVFTSYVVGEVLTSMWMTTYLVEADDMTIAEASWYGSAFFVCIAASRFLMIFERFHRRPKRVLTTCILLGTTFSILGVSGWRFCLPLVGILGPFFPMMLARAGSLYTDRYRTITIYIFVTMQVTLMTMHFLIGHFSEEIAISQSYLLAPYALVITLILLFIHFRISSKVESS